MDFHDHQMKSKFWMAKPSKIWSLPTSPSTINPCFIDYLQLYQLFIVPCISKVCHILGYKQ